MKRGQVSLEYLLIVGFVLVIIIPVTLLAYDGFSSSQDTIKERQAQKALSTLVREAETVYYIGPPSQSTFDIYFPEDIFLLRITNGEATILLQTSNGIQDISIPSRINMTGTISTTPGTKRVTVTAQGFYVDITE